MYHLALLQWHMLANKKLTESEAGVVDGEVPEHVRMLILVMV